MAVRPALPFFTSRARPHDITETTRGNLFIQDQDGFWCTPPLDEQVLPGVTRREVLDLLDDQRRRHESGVAQCRSYASHAAPSGPAASAGRFRSLPSMAERSLMSLSSLQSSTSARHELTASVSDIVRGEISHGNVSADVQTAPGRDHRTADFTSGSVRRDVDICNRKGGHAESDG